MEKKDKHVHGPNCDHNKEPSPSPTGNPLASLDEDTQKKIQELQMMEQQFQQFLMQKNAFSMELNETDYIIKEVEKTKGEISRIIGNQVVIKTTREEILEDMKNKKRLIETRMKSLNEQEKDFSKGIEEIREEVMKKIQG